MFKLDERLKNDTFEVCEFLDCKILAMNNSIIPWFIIVPYTDKIEWYELDDSIQYNINKIANTLSKFIVKDFNTNKINIATLGNVVKQMHIHVMGRFINDPAWPAPFWGCNTSKEYNQKEKQQLIEKVKKLFF